MSTSTPELVLSSAPFVRQGLGTRRVMAEVIAATLPVVATATWYFGAGALLLVLASVAGACLVEWTFGTDRRGLGSLTDGTAMLTGILMALTLPPSMPLWMAGLGGAVGVGLGKTMWGGLGQNLFNPALVGRAFLQAAFPTTITTWTAPGQGVGHIDAAVLALPLMHGAVDGVSAATPLGLAKFEGAGTDTMLLLLGNTGGSLGETSAVVLLAVGAVLVARRVFDWRLAASTLLAVAALSGLFHAIDPEAYQGPLFMLLSGGLMFATVFMVTDPVTTPITPKGAWIFGLGTGALVVLIRYWGGLPEGVMYAVLLMNSVTPLINRVTQPRPFGG
jgi:electron transport complex protein RnfD